MHLISLFHIHFGDLHPGKIRKNIFLCNRCNVAGKTVVGGNIPQLHLLFAVSLCRNLPCPCTLGAAGNSNRQNTCQHKCQHPFSVSFRHFVNPPCCSHPDSTPVPADFIKLTNIVAKGKSKIQ